MVLLDGACGTCLYEKAEQRGLERKPVWMYSIEAPDMVEELAGEYIAAGTRIIQTNTFNANPKTVEREGFDLEEVISAGVRIAQKAAGRTQNANDKCRVSLDIGPLTDFLEPYGDMTEEECSAIFAHIIKAGLFANHSDLSSVTGYNKTFDVDLITLETFIDLNMLRIAAGTAAAVAEDALSKVQDPSKAERFTVICSMSYQKDGKTLFGNTPEDLCSFANEFAQAHPLIDVVIGINCSFGPKAALDVLNTYSENSRLPLLFKPNAEEGISAESFAELAAAAFEKADYTGSCCGSNPDFIRALADIN